MKKKKNKSSQREYVLSRGYLDDAGDLCALMREAEEKAGNMEEIYLRRITLIARVED